ncbi:unnamed protein product, partial [Meganyctiphanes norvegica]
KISLKYCIVCCIVLSTLVFVWGIMQSRSVGPRRSAAASRPPREGSHCSGRQPFIPRTREELPIGHAPDVPNYFPVDEADFCNSSPDLKIIAYVISTIAATEKRNVTRQTWGSAYKCGINMKLVFMVGNPKDENEEKILKTESGLYHDIVQGNYTEDYHLVTYKILSSMHWVSSRCPSVPWVIRADDDILVDPFLLNHRLTKASKEGFSCYVWPRGSNPVGRVGKWAVTRQEWKERTWPTFCAGAFVFHHHQLLHRLLEASCSAPVLWLEDVYVFGILAEEAGGVNPKLSVLNPHHKKDGIKTKDIGRGGSINQLFYGNFVRTP